MVIQFAAATTQEPSEHLIGVAAGQVLPVVGQFAATTTQEPSEHLIGFAAGHVFVLFVVEQSAITAVQEPLGH